ncbi:DnaJ domain-containing protein [Desertifilum sp. FACHB-1129]|uniref:J domain-containing protein n=1 Tax=Desertifilum tharense IPPAS B-1220 TaxID=1781255 RepID=A0A1E5QMZ2_9CYAN|nr:MULTISPECIES: DnaJ domain-containing protein [Desertifilum]MDA0208822.1 DnaJ domain-containing protein [Cyanobacteria bacterium FC1]MBD2311023.1 DnaJ domain-containing protein [Desertifilum sp. FACHB-1129]MBD2321428.1 DnaJ domain-containing protein [Desertifilum sp. FACHB-866]MBD2331265.1 DnaJ domain-containing protein [Desertifilum sp. FACHB-868]OEJ75964.1 hypothetical protein BH720_06710 [Desertifilum tharense IPPAS B-1220]
MQNPSIGAGWIGSGTVAGTVINIAYGNAGLAFSGTAIKMGMTPFAMAGGAIAAASYGIFEATLAGDPTALLAAGVGGLSGATLSIQLGGVGLAFQGTAVQLGILPITLGGSVVGLAVYGLLKLLDTGNGGEAPFQLFERMATQWHDQINQQTAYQEALLELDSEYAEWQWLQKFAELELQEEFAALQQEIHSWQESLQAQWRTTPSLPSPMTSQTSTTWQCLQTLKTHAAPLNSVSLSEDGQRLATGHQDGSVSLWNVATGTCTYSFYGHSQEVLAVAVSSQQGIVVSAGGNRENRYQINSWNLATQTLLKSFFYPETAESHASVIYALAITPDSKTLVSASADRTIRLWDLKSGRGLRTLQGHEDSVNAIAISPEGQFLVSGSADKTVKIWSLKNAQTLHTLREHSGWVTTVAVSPNGLWLASGSTDKSVNLWNLQTGELLRTFNHAHTILSVAFSPNSDLLASAGPKGKIQLWQVETGELLDTLEGFDPVAFFPEGLTLLSGGKGRNLKLWQPGFNPSKYRQRSPELHQWWEVLGVEQTATPDRVKQAYRHLARQYHPDLNSSTQAKLKMQAINQAYRQFRAKDC